MAEPKSDVEQEKTESLSAYFIPLLPVKMGSMIRGGDRFRIPNDVLAAGLLSMVK